MNLLSELRKIYKYYYMYYLLILQRANTGVRMLDSIYQMTLVLLFNFWRENVNILPSFTQMDVIM